MNEMHPSIKEMSHNQLIAAASRRLAALESDPILVELLSRFQDAVSVLSMVGALRDQITTQLASVRGFKK